MSATRPATNGDAMLVPERTVKALLTTSSASGWERCDIADVMPAPGAVTSGFRPRFLKGPSLLKLVIL
jgi:hypothetical protein